MKAKKPVIILIAEDDDDDFIMTRDALEESRLLNELHRVKNGVELMDYLLHRGNYENHVDAPLPALILLDLNMPLKDGREALKEIKEHTTLRRIPVVVLTTSKAEEDIVRTYDIGVNSFIQKPVAFSAFVEAIKVMNQYWFEIVALPEQ